MIQLAPSERLTMDAMVSQSNTGICLLPQEEFDAIIRRHWGVHVKLNKKQAKLDPEDDQNNAGDLSCLRCYPINEQQETSTEFDNFWNGWFKPLHSPRQYTQNTIDCFQAARAEKKYEVRKTKYEHLSLLIFVKVCGTAIFENDCV